MRILGPQTAWCGGYCASEIHWIDCETECSSFANALRELVVSGLFCPPLFYTLLFYSQVQALRDNFFCCA